MNKDLLIDAMGLIPDDMLQEAEEYQCDLEMAVNENEEKKKSGIVEFITGHRIPIGIAASIAIFVLACVVFASLKQRNRFDRTETMENTLQLNYRILLSIRLANQTAVQHQAMN